MTTRLDTCTSSTRPATPADGQVLFETDTNNMIVADVSDGRWYSYESEGFFSTAGGGGGDSGGGGVTYPASSINPNRPQLGQGSGLKIKIQDWTTKVDHSGNGATSFDSLYNPYAATNSYSNAIYYEPPPGDAGVLYQSAYTAAEMGTIVNALEYLQTLVTTDHTLTIVLGEMNIDDEGIDIGADSNSLGHAMISDQTLSGTDRLMVTYVTKNFMGQDLLFGLPKVAYLEFNKGDHADILSNSAGNDHRSFGGVQTTELYWITLHEALHCLGLGALWNGTNHTVSGRGSLFLQDVQAECATRGLPTSGSQANIYELTAAGAWLCIGPSRYVGHYGNLKYNELSGFGTFGGPLSIPIGTNQAHFTGHATNSVYYNNPNSLFIQHVDGNYLLRMPKQDCFVQKFWEYTHVNNGRFISPLTLACLEDIGYEVDYTKCDLNPDNGTRNFSGGQYTSIGQGPNFTNYYIGGSDKSHGYTLNSYDQDRADYTFNWFGGVMGPDNSFAMIGQSGQSQASDGHPHTIPCGRDASSIPI